MEGVLPHLVALGAPFLIACVVIAVAWYMD